MSELAPWDAFLREHFPGYLLPDTARLALSREEATRFLEQLTGRPHALALLRAASTVSPRVAALRDFSLRLLPAWVRVLPSRTNVAMREWEGGFQGRLDLHRTLAHELAGRPTRFVTRSRTRSFALPENVLVRAAAERLLHLLVDLRQAELLATAEWGGGLQECEGALRHLLNATLLREVPCEHITPLHEQAAHASRSPVHRAALSWWSHLRDGLDSEDPAVIARVVAEGALQPLKEHTRFEVAVAMRLLQTLAAHLERVEPGRWQLQRSMVMRSREDIASFERQDGARVRVFYNQAWLDAGPAELGGRHYLGHGGRMRPDITIVSERDGHMCAAVIEVKHSRDPSYLLRGFHEAMLYRWEYAPLLKGWPKAILVTSADVDSPLRTQDDVVAVGWSRWVPESVVEGLLSGVLSRA